MPLYVHVVPLSIVYILVGPHRPRRYLCVRVHQGECVVGIVPGSAIKTMRVIHIIVYLQLDSQKLAAAYHVNVYVSSILYVTTTVLYSYALYM